MNYWNRFRDSLYTSYSINEPDFGSYTLYSVKHLALFFAITRSKKLFKIHLKN